MLTALENTTYLPENFSDRAATLADINSCVDLLNTCALDQIGVAEFTAIDLQNEWQTPDFSLEHSTRLVFSETEKLVGYIEVWDLAPVPVNIWVWARVHPDYEGLGIGSYLMTWAEKRARQAIVRAPEQAQVVMRVGTLSTHQPSQQLFLERGMTLKRHFWRMTATLAEKPAAPRWPDGIGLKTFADMPDLMPVLETVDASFQDHFGHVDQPIEEELKRWQHWIKNDPKFDPALWFLALKDGEIVAVCLCAPEADDDPEMGFVNTLGVKRPFRRQGLALALLHHSFNIFYQMGKKRVGLGVDADSLTGAPRLYEKAGMTVSRQFDAYELELRSGINLARE